MIPPQLIAENDRRRFRAERKQFLNRNAIKIIVRSEGRNVPLSELNPQARELEIERLLSRAPADNESFPGDPDSLPIHPGTGKPPVAELVSAPAPAAIHAPAVARSRKAKAKKNPARKQRSR